ncbi:MAG: hypothetical protein ACFCGT_18625 [Sandaracinaceae bacterium]
MTALDPALAARLLRRFDFNRAPLGPSSRGEGYKEWLYFGVGSASLDIVVVFATTDGPRRRPVPRVCRLLLFVRDEGGWRGWVERSTAARGRLPGGDLGAFVHRSRVTPEAGGFRLDLAPRDAPIRGTLLLEPRSLPVPLHQRPAANAPAMSWVVVPRLRASGVVEVEGTRHEIPGAPAYHDHNWGTFDFGHDFTWEWGYSLFEERAPWSFVMVRFADATRSRALEQTLFLWRGPKQARVLTDRSLTVRRQGRLRPDRLPKVPGSLRLLVPGNATDVPERFEVEGALGADRVEMSFVSEQVLQLLVPDAGGFGVSRIHEVAGRVTLVGQVRGEPFRQEGRGVFEFLAT